MRWTRGRGTSAASFSSSSNGESVMPVVPSDHGLVNVKSGPPVDASRSPPPAPPPRAVRGDKAPSLPPPMGGDLRVGVERKPVDAGTAGARESGRSPFITNPRPNTPYLLTGPL